MGNSQPKPDGKNKKKGKGKKEKPAAQSIDEEEADEEASRYMTISVVFEMKSGSTTKPEELDVDPNTLLSDWKEDLKQTRGIRTSVAVRRDNHKYDLGPETLSLETLGIEKGDIIRFRECA